MMYYIRHKTRQCALTNENSPFYSKCRAEVTVCLGRWGEKKDFWDSSEQILELRVVDVV